MVNCILAYHWSFALYDVIRHYKLLQKKNSKNLSVWFPELDRHLEGEHLNVLDFFVARMKTSIKASNIYNRDCLRYKIKERNNYLVILSNLLNFNCDNVDLSM